MQEAYRLPCSEYSFCCPILADPPPGWPPPRLTPPPGWLTPPADWPPPKAESAELPPPPDVDRLKTLPSPILQMRAVINPPITMVGALLMTILNPPPITKIFSNQGKSFKFSRSFYLKKIEAFNDNSRGYSAGKRLDTILSAVAQVRFIAPD